MSLSALLALASFLALFSLANFVFYIDPKKTLHRLFALFCLSCAYWAFCEFMFLTAEDAQTAHLWRKIYAFWSFIGAFMVHFVLVFTEKRAWLKRRATLFLVYAPSVLFSWTALATDLMVERISYGPFGWRYQPAERSWFYWATVAWAIALLFTIPRLLWRFFSSTEDPLKRRQARYVLISILGLIGGGILELLSIRTGLNFPLTVTPTMALMCFLIAYGVWQHRLFILSPATAAEIILSTMPDGCLLADPSGRIVVVNESLSRWFGRPKEELSERRLPDLFPSVAWSGEGGFHAGRPLTGKGGESRETDISIAPVRREGGSLLGHVLIARDVTERRRLEKESRDLRQRLLKEERTASVGQLAWHVAREIESPLESILDSSADLLTGLAADDPRRLPLDYIHKEALRCRSLLQDLSAFSLLMEPPGESCDVNAEVSSALSSLGVGSDVTLEVLLPDGLPPARMPAALLRQIPLQLGRRALAAMPAGGRLRVETRLTPEEAAPAHVILVEDSGDPIPPEKMTWLFDPSSGVRGGAREGELGLYLVQQIVREHGGRLAVENLKPGGTRFQVLLPLQ
jgi:PAS domain S-box-containing protein